MEAPGLPAEALSTVSGFAGALYWGTAEDARTFALALAQRVAAERGTAVGGLIGYRIGHDASATSATRVTFCTTGWLLQFLVATTAEEAAAAAREEEARAVLAKALASAGHVLIGISSTDPKNIERAEALLPEVEVVSVPEIIEKSDLVLLAIPAEEISKTVSGLAEAG